MICEPPVAFSVRILTLVELARAAPDAIIMHQPRDDPRPTPSRAMPASCPTCDASRWTTWSPRCPERIHPSATAPPRRLPAAARCTLGLADRLVVSTPRPGRPVRRHGRRRTGQAPNCLEWSRGRRGPAAAAAQETPRRLGRRPAAPGRLELIYLLHVSARRTRSTGLQGHVRPAKSARRITSMDFTGLPGALPARPDQGAAPETWRLQRAKKLSLYFEYGAMGWPVICTDIHPYQNAPVTRLPNEPENGSRRSASSSPNPRLCAKPGWLYSWGSATASSSRTMRQAGLPPTGYEGRRIPRLKACCQPAEILPAVLLFEAKALILEAAVIKPGGNPARFS